MSVTRITAQKMPVIESDGFTRDYGVVFTDEFSQHKQQLADIAGAMAEHLPQLTGRLSDQTVHYDIPSQVLSSSLTTAQRDAINRNETPKVARYTVQVQDELARVPIVENYERLRSVAKYLGDQGVLATFSDVPFHEACGEWAGKGRVFWVRERFAERLTVFGQLLNHVELQPHFEDAFRPVGVQEGLFKRRVAWTKRDYPDWSEEQIIQEAMSKTAVKPRLASHKAAAAADARLRSTVTGNILDFGHNYPDGGAIVFAKTPFVTAEQWRNRQIFYVASQLSGLTLYVGEDWHVSYGDNLASLDANGVVNPTYVAQYGPIKSFDEERGSGEITEVYGNNELDNVFDF